MNFYDLSDGWSRPYMKEYEKSFKDSNFQFSKILIKHSERRLGTSFYLITIYYDQIVI